MSKCVADERSWIAMLSLHVLNRYPHSCVISAYMLPERKRSSVTLNLYAQVVADIKRSAYAK